MPVSAISSTPGSPPFTVRMVANGNPAEVGDASCVLAAIGFAPQAQLLHPERPVFTVGLPRLAGNTGTEVWHSALPVSVGQYADTVYSSNGNVLFGHSLLAESAFKDLRQATTAAYRQLFELLRQQGYPYLLRMWNYFPAITEQDGALNRYQQFCLGRQAALDHYGHFACSPPAATAIGTQQAGLQVYFLAAKRGGIQLENPRQTSAFLYPRQYGPVSPAFSRATVCQWQHGVHLYISGTTSIVGHETLHIGDPLAQLDETLRNLEALLQHGAETLELPLQQVRELHQLKVYVHAPQHLPRLQARLDAYLKGSETAVLYLQGDVCRAELVVEMEGIFA